MHVPIIRALITHFHSPFIHDAFSQVRIRHVELSKTDGITITASDLGQSCLAVERIIADQNSSEVWSKCPADILDLVLGGDGVVIEDGLWLG